MIVLTNVSKSYGPKRALSSINLTVEGERCVALIGTSGSGKSTLLRLILGLTPPDSGEITIAGTPMRPETAQGLRLRIGYVIQDGGLFPHLTALDNVTLMARVGAWDPGDVRQRVATLTTLVGLSDELLGRYPAELSGGERQRVGLMRALMLDPAVLLLDEPMGALDPVTRARLQDDLRRIFRELRKTVLLVTHDLGEAAFLADRVAVLDDGAVVQEGSMRELVERPRSAFVSDFLQAQRPRWTPESGGP